VIGTCTPVLGELHHGFENSDSRDRNRQQLLVALPALVIWPYDVRAAAEYGRIQAELQRRGRPMQQIDVQIAAIAKLLPGCIVVSMDSDMFRVPGLAVEDWTK
jgi:tRNA(fMet)-specific endonuclease VapC